MTVRWTNVVGTVIAWMSRPLRAWDYFDNTRLVDFTGLSLTAAVEKAKAEGRLAFVLHPWSDVTLDFRPDRLNLRLDAVGDLDGMSAG